MTSSRHTHLERLVVLVVVDKPATGTALLLTILERVVHRDGELGLIAGGFVLELLKVASLYEESTFRLNLSICRRNWFSTSTSITMLCGTFVLDVILGDDVLLRPGTQRLRPFDFDGVAWKRGLGDENGISLCDDHVRREVL